MTTRDMSHWETGIARVVSDGETEEVMIRGHPLSGLIGRIGFAEMVFLLLQGRLPAPGEARLLDGLMVAAAEHGIAPPSMIGRCFASYGTTLQAALAGGVLSFGDVMGGAGEQLAERLAGGVAPLRAGGGVPDDEAVRRTAADLVAEVRRAGGRVPGYGIPLHGADPRAPALVRLARETGGLGPHLRLALAVEAALAEAAGRPVPLNLDGVGAAIVLDLGFEWRAARLFIIMPRTVSMAAHFLEERAQGTRWRHLPAEQIDSSA